MPQYLKLSEYQTYSFEKSDTELGHIPKANQDLSKYANLPDWFKQGYKTNSLGLFDYEHYKKNGPRILGLGDSFFQGYGVPFRDTVLYVLEKITGIEIIKAGIARYGTAQEFILLKRLFPIFKPDIVLLGFCIWNDVQDNIKWSHLGSTGNNDSIISVSVDGVKNKTIFTHMKTLFRKSALFHFMLDRLKYFSISRKILLNYKFVEETVPEEIQPYAVNYTHEWQAGWNDTFKALQQISLFTKKNDAHLVVVIIPTLTQVYPQLWEKIKNYYFLDASKYEPYKPIRVLLEFCQAQNIDFLNLYDCFYEHGKNKLLYDGFRPGTHWNKEGNEVAAQCIKEFLVSEELLIRDRVLTR
jgi:hypothetical protein